MDILWVDPKGVGQFIHIVFEHLVRPAQGQLVAVPLRDRGVGFHRRRAMPACAIGFVHGVGGLRQGGVQITLGGLFFLRCLDLCRFQVGDRIVGRDLKLDHMGRMAGLLERIGDHQTHGLTDIGNLAVRLHRCFVRGALGGITQEGLAVEHTAHPIQLADRLGVQAGDLTARDRGAHQNAGQHARGLILMCIGGPA